MGLPKGTTRNPVWVPVVMRVGLGDLDVIGEARSEPTEPTDPRLSRRLNSLPSKVYLIFVMTAMDSSAPKDICPPKRMSMYRQRWHVG
jgi:hypothetical protein